MVHILPFFLSSGDRGFAPLGYEKVSEEFGNWEDVRMLSEEYPLMFDYMINHISAHSPYYQDFLENKDQSPYRGLFIRYKDFWKNGMPSQAETDAIYKRKPRAPYVMAEFADQTQEAVWCTSVSYTHLDVYKRQREGHHVGLWNIKRTMEVLYQKKKLIHLSNLETGGCLIEIWIPKTTAVGEEQEIKNERIDRG